MNNLRILLWLILAFNYKNPEIDHNRVQRLMSDSVDFRIDWGISTIENGVMTITKTTLCGMASFEDREFIHGLPSSVWLKLLEDENTNFNATCWLYDLLEIDITFQFPFIEERRSANCKEEQLIFWQSYFDKRDALKNDYDQELFNVHTFTRPWQ